jgi:hypothetical protein
LTNGYLEEEVAVHEPAGVPQPNKLQDLGELLHQIRRRLGLRSRLNN